MKKISTLPVLVLAGLIAVGVSASAQSTSPGGSTGRTRTYYIAANEVTWDYAPGGVNQITGQPFGNAESLWVASGPQRIGKVLKKALYREYTDATFARLKPRPKEWEHLGFLGPLLRAEVGDTIQVVFKNNGSHHYSIHPHGVFYEKDAEGTATNDGTSGKDKLDDSVHPGETFTYVWHVPERSGPGPDDPSSIVWLYHSHEVAEEYAGLVGPIVISSAEYGTASGIPSDVDQEVISFFSVMDENQSMLLEDNITKRAPHANDPDGGDGDEFYESNLMHSINGYVYGNGPRLKIREGSRVRWHLIALGTEVDLHTPHWHGNVVTAYGTRTDVIELLPASMKSVDMLPDDPGTWMFHCHVNDHIKACMIALYTVTPATTGK